MNVNRDFIHNYSIKVQVEKSTFERNPALFFSFQNEFRPQSERQNKMNFRSVIIAAVLSIVYASKTKKDDNACNGCAENCSIVPPKDATKYPCYQGLPEDTKDCFNNDIAINDDAIWACGNCADFGYPNYLRNDPVYRKMGLWTTEKIGVEGNSVCKSCDKVCALVPPAGSEAPCYEGGPSDAAFCYSTDPIIQDGTTWHCDGCSAHGFSHYLHNDPAYTNMGLWLNKEKN